MSSPDEFLKRVYIDALIGSACTTPFSNDMAVEIERCGWFQTSIHGDGVAIHWNLEFLQQRSLNELMKIYNFCKTGKVRD